MVRFLKHEIMSLTPKHRPYRWLYRCFFHLGGCIVLLLWLMFLPVGCFLLMLKLFRRINPRWYHKLVFALLVSVLILEIAIPDYMEKWAIPLLLIVVPYTLYCFRIVLLEGCRWLRGRDIAMNQQEKNKKNETDIIDADAVGLRIVRCPKCSSRNRIRCDSPTAEYRCGNCHHLLLIPFPLRNFEETPRKSRPLRIVMVNDEEGPLRSCELVIRRWFKDVTLLSFSDSSEAWQELSRTDPDLLITDDTMPVLGGEEIVRRLADREATYPIVVLSSWGDITERWVMEFAIRGFNVSLLPVPFDIKSFAKALETALKITIPSDAPRGDEADR